MKERHLPYLYVAELALSQYDIGQVKIDDSGVVGDIGFDRYRMVKFRAAGASGGYVVTVYEANGGRDILDSRRTIRSHCLWLQALSGDTDLGVQVPVLNRSQGPITEVRADNGDVLIVTVLHWLEGEIVWDNYGAKRAVDLPASVLRKVGAVLGQLHSHSSQWALPAGFERPVSESERLHRNLSRLGRATDEGRISRADFEVLAQAVELFRDNVGGLGKSPGTWGLLHGDFSCGNCIMHGDVVCPIDLDWCCFGYYQGDIGWSFVVKNMSSELRRAFLEGYAEHRELPDGLRMIEGFFIESWIRLESWGASDPNNRFPKLPHFVESACRKYLNSEPFLLEWTEAS